mmetsp:Transcript_4837/g.6395  ORF Transcript_4837/g.6395 Transcript_4837/m.6395 type:complete len:134 (-) Transcript_4837:943-1344(-)
MAQNGDKCWLGGSSSRESFGAQGAARAKKSWNSFFERNKIEKRMMQHLTDAMQRPEILQFLCKKCSTMLFTSEQVVSHGLRSVKTVQGRRNPPKFIKMTGQSFSGAAKPPLKAYAGKKTPREGVNDPYLSEAS